MSEGTTWTLADLAALDAALKKGVRRVQYQGESVEYHSMAEMLRLRDQMRAELGLTTAATTRVAGFRSGL